MEPYFSGDKALSQGIAALTVVSQGPTGGKATKKSHSISTASPERVIQEDP